MMNTAGLETSHATAHQRGMAWPFGLVAVAAFGGVAAALITQHVYGMDPCAWCVLQRLVLVLVGVVAVIGLLWQRVTASRLAGSLVVTLSLAGVAAALWQQFVASKSASCNLTLADRIVSGLSLDQLLPGIFEARASCADAAVSLAGVPYALWSAMLFALCAIIAVRAVMVVR